jgi:hypothetical protein
MAQTSRRWLKRSRWGKEGQKNQNKFNWPVTIASLLPVPTLKRSPKLICGRSPCRIRGGFISVMRFLGWDLCRDTTQKIFVWPLVRESNISTTAGATCNALRMRPLSWSYAEYLSVTTGGHMITLDSATSHKNYNQVIWFWIFGPSYKVFIGSLICWLRSSNGMPQREAVSDPSCRHRVGTVKSFLYVQI